MVAYWTRSFLPRALPARARHEQGYEQLLAAMRRAEETMAPVLTAIPDQVLFLKHNLNAAVEASLQNSVLEIETNVSALIAEMEASIEEANQLIDGIPSS